MATQAIQRSENLTVIEPTIHGEGGGPAAAAGNERNGLEQAGAAARQAARKTAPRNRNGSRGPNFGQGINFFHIENWYSIHSVIRTTLKLLGLYGRGRNNAERIQIRHNHVGSKILPNQFDGFTLLHISDLHVDMSEGAMRRLNEILPGLIYDICVLTGDYRGATFGPFDAALEGLARARAHLKGQSTECWEITIPFAWCQNSKKLEFGYCSTNAS